MTIVLTVPIRSKAVSFDILGGKLSNYGAEQVTVEFYASNDIGTVFVAEKNITLTG